MKIKELFRKYNEAEARVNAADDAWENDYENESLEKEFDEAYKAEHKAFTELANEIEKLTGGAIDAKTFRAMMAKQRNELESLVARIA